MPRFTPAGILEAFIASPEAQAVARQLTEDELTRRKSAREDIAHHRAALDKEIAAVAAALPQIDEEIVRARRALRDALARKGRAMASRQIAYDVHTPALGVAEAFLISTADDRVRAVLRDVGARLKTLDSKLGNSATTADFGEQVALRSAQKALVALQPVDDALDGKIAAVLARVPREAALVAARVYVRELVNGVLRYAPDPSEPGFVKHEREEILRKRDALAALTVDDPKVEQHVARVLAGLKS